MDEAPGERLIEWGMDVAAAAFLAASLAFAWLKLAGSGPGAALVPGAAFVIAFAGLRRIGPESATFTLPLIEAREVPIDAALEELVLTSEMAVPAECATDELVLDDVLARLDPGARVVQLFRPPAIPTAGELKANIDRHLREGRRPGPPDATDALHDALAELRRSLR